MYLISVFLINLFTYKKRKKNRKCFAYGTENPKNMNKKFNDMWPQNEFNQNENIKMDKWKYIEKEDLNFFFFFKFT